MTITYSMLNFVLTVVGCLFGLWLLCRVIAWLIIWTFWKIARVDVKIRRVGLFTLGGIYLSPRKDIVVEIERLWISSSWINGEIRKPIGLCAGDVRIQVEVAGSLSEQVSKAHPSRQLDSKLPSWLCWFHYISVILENTHVIILHGLVKDCLTHINVEEIVAFTTITSASLEACVSVEALALRVLKKKEADVPKSPCIAELSGNLKTQLLVDIENKHIEIADLAVKKPFIQITESFISKIDNFRKMRQSNSVLDDEDFEDSNISAVSTSPSPFNHKIIPNKINLDISEIKIVLNKESQERQLHVFVNFFLLDYLQEAIGDYLSRAAILQIQDVTVASPQVNLINLQQLTSNIKLTEHLFSSDIKMQACFVGYHHEEVNYWLSLFTSLRDQQPNILVSPRPKRKFSRKQNIMQKQFKVKVELEDMSGMMATASCAGMKAGLSSVKFQTVLRLPKTDGVDVTNGCDMKTECEARGLYLKLTQNGAPAAQLSAKLHHWNTVGYMGTSIFKVHKRAEELSVDCMLDSVQLEWSSALSAVSDQLLNILHLSPPVREDSPTENNLYSLPPPNKSSLRKILHDATVHVQFSNINCYICHSLQVACCLRLDSVNCQQRSGEATLESSGLKMVYCKQNSQYVPTSRSHEIQNYSLHLKSLEVAYKQRTKELSMKVSEELYMLWTTALHLCIFYGIEEMKEIQQRIKGLRNSAKVEVPPSNISPSRSSMRITVKIRANTMVALQLSKAHRVAFSIPEIYIVRKPSQTTVTAPLASIMCDQHEIISIAQLAVEKKTLQYERSGFDVITKATNRGWQISMDRFEVTFPFQYNFAACFHELLGINKWRKMVHKLIKTPFPVDGSLPPDIVIKIQAVVVQICDDPFEVKLGDNYELLADECSESEKRITAMDKKIEELRKKFAFLPASKVDELYLSLNKKNAEVYMQRSRQLYASTPMRTKLFTWTLDELEFTAMADPSLYGKENVIKHMRDIDKDSPYPEEGMEFSTLWCRVIDASCSKWKFQLRDYPTPMLEITKFSIWGRLIGAESMPTKRAQRYTKVEVEEPWGDMNVVRNMPPLKFYHDLQSEINRYQMAYGPCWEPVITQVSLCMNLINRPSVDPSRPLPFWDKFRLLLHGRLTASVAKMSWLYHASQSPYNKTEMMDWTWSNLILDWTNAKWVLKGDLDIYSRTASKYDDCRFLHLPNLRLSIRLEWLCGGDPNDHHSVMPCAPDKVPEYSLQEHDSYRAFRSHNLNMSLSFETKPLTREAAEEVTQTSPGGTVHAQLNPDDRPSCLFYASTLRWMDKVKMCMQSVSRPTRRGKYWQTTTLRKPPFTRHVKKLQFSFHFHQFEVCYWVSFAKQHGVEMQWGDTKITIGMQLCLMPFKDKLVHRPRAEWSIKYFNTEGNGATIWLCSSSSDGQEEVSLRGPVKKSYLMSLEKVSYQRDEEKLPSEDPTPEEPDKSFSIVDEIPTHTMKIENLKGEWSPSNRNVALQLYDGYIAAQTLKKNLASEALKGYKVESKSQTPSKKSSSSLSTPPVSGALTPTVGGTFASATSPSPMSKIQSGHAYSMLQKLVSEADNKFVAVSHEVTGASVQIEQLHGIAACQTDDVVQKVWHIELYNSQVLLRGCETPGYVIVSAAKSSILSCEHQPVWKQRQLKSKDTWVGSIEGMQYFATVESPVGEDSVTWLKQEDIEERHEVDGGDLTEVPEMVGSGQSVGGVVSDTVGASDVETGVIQLQRIISRCKCQFFFASYGEVDPETNPEIPPLPSEDSDMMEREEGIDSFTLLHHDLNCCTNSLQYAMILDIINNNLLYIQPKKKEVTDKILNMRFGQQLGNTEDSRPAILQRQNNLRKLVASIRRIERELYLTHKSLDKDPDNPEVLEQQLELETQLYESKQQVWAASEELDIIINCFKESQLQFKLQEKGTTRSHHAQIVRRNEVFFKQAEWRMTDTDGQIGIADLVLRNFLYTKVNKDDDSGSHQLELGWVKVTNLLPNTIYTTTLHPQDFGQANHQMVLRILCRFKAPVGGISVKEHFEVNVMPLTIQLSHKFYKKLFAFFFPEKTEPEESSVDDDDASSVSGSSVSNQSVTSKRENKRIRGKVNYPPSDINDIDKMKERAAMNNLFVYVKIPEVPMKVSYKGNKDKNIEDVRDLSLLLPTLEYHNQTWTWLDFLMAVKKDTKKVLIGQAIKQKLHMKSRTSNELDLKSENNKEADKARMLLGAKLVPGNEKPSSKKSLFGKKKGGTD